MTSSLAVKEAKRFLCVIHCFSLNTNQTNYKSFNKKVDKETLKIQANDKHMEDKSRNKHVLACWLALNASSV